MYTLYARAGSGSAAVEAVLAECGVEFQLIDIPRNGPAHEDYKRINPLGKVPSLRLLDQSVMTESAAIVIYLADLYLPAKLAPAWDSPLRPVYLRWILYFASFVYSDSLRYYYAARNSIDEGAANGIKAKAAIDMERDFSIFSNALGNGPYILGDVFSAADIYTAMLISWAPDVRAVFSRHPNIKRHYDLVAARPKINPIWKRNEMLFV